MKELNVNLKFSVPDDTDCIGFSELIDYMHDCIWDIMYEYNEMLMSYSITDGHDTYRRDFDYEEDEDDASE